ncbi:xenotropic and polytropic retrovirus receptor 1 [Anaeramoeba flamelloides]|uniref:Xenotropic and polytropic retrovirus receptor n=1 Tax=Anaeramoeba flamelloides TaxID=1746091 RepID=A0AAV7ZUI6_9EUKA|nr:xenotropic and polytropic retrovirus receptor [Anaeramoeba flamelloides]KAJ6252429.1 xenotropic and polytropic retrovirus receptor 1 [Anaeramoeba flamelloides]
MTFNEIFYKYQKSRWPEYFLKYAELKKTINEISYAKQKQKPTLNNKFFKDLDKQLSNVNKFYLFKEQELIKNFPFAVKYNDRDVLVKKGTDKPIRFRLNAYKVELGSFYCDLRDLKTFQQLNFRAARKLMKKHKTFSGMKLADKKWLEIKQLGFNKSPNIDKLFKNTIVVYSCVFTKKNPDKAKKELEEYRVNLTRKQNGLSTKKPRNTQALDIWDQISKLDNSKNQEDEED